MANKIFAAIDVGSNELSMKIYAVSYTHLTLPTIA